MKLSFMSSVFVIQSFFNPTALNYDDGFQYAIQGGVVADPHLIGKVDITEADCIVGSESALTGLPEIPQDLTYSTAISKFFFRTGGAGETQKLFTVETDGTTVLIATSTPSIVQRGLAFALTIGADTTPPVISTSASEPISIPEDSV
ncbi:MAG: hypothetical protein IH784_08860, partial [Bacteroidetes bacterium]|nr:hypothetical protein [Bacteroidota bacterium]